MKNIPWVGKIAFVLAIILTVPYAVTAQQKALSVSSLQSTYTSQTAFLKQKIYNAQADYKVSGCNGGDNDKMQCYQDNIDIAKAQDDLHTVQLAYQLVLNSLK